MKSSNYLLIHILIVPILFSLILYNSNFSGEGDKKNNEYYFISLNFLQNSYAIESDEKDENITTIMILRKQKKKKKMNLKITRENQFLIS